MIYGLYIVFFVVLLIPFSYIDANGLEPGRKVIPQKEIPIGNEAKIDSDIRQLLKEQNSELARPSIPVENEEIEVYIYLDSKSDKIPENIPVLSRAENIIFAKLSAHQISSVADLDTVKRIGLPIKGIVAGHAVSEGINFSFANQMHFAGYTGSGITVAVIDDSFFTSDPEISSNILSTTFGAACSDIACGATSGNSHGTAVAEIVVDMAPDVDLRLYASLDLVDVLNAIDNAMANNVDIITISLGFPEDGGDGTSGFYRDGTSFIAKKVNEAKNAGILVTTSAGNQGESHWKGTYSPSSVMPSSIGLGELETWESLMNFRPSESGVQQVCLPVNDLGDIYVTSWNDWVASDQDYDFFLYDSSLTEQLDSSIGFQGGTEPPIEVMPSGIPQGSACLVLASYISTQNHFFHINAGDNSIDASVRVSAGSIDTPADASGALAVGAIDQATDTLEGFSSSGPTDDSRLKPEICGPDNTLSHQSDLNPFTGTSAATPHVAGAAALLLEQNPSLSVDQLRDKLINDARFDASYSVDNLCGSNSGALSLQLPSPIFTAIRTGINTIILTFSENVDTTTIAGQGYTLSTGTVTANTDPAGSSNIMTLTTTGVSGTSATPTVTYGTAAGTTVDTEANEVADGANAVASDGVSPTFTATRTSPTTWILIFSEAVDAAANENTAWTISGGHIVTAVTDPAGETTLTITASASTGTTGGQTITYVAASGTVADAAANEVANGAFAVASAVASNLCSAPLSGEWFITSSCTITGSIVAPSNVHVQDGAIVTIENGGSLNIDFTTKFLKVHSGSGVLVKAGGKII